MLRQMKWRRFISLDVGRGGTSRTRAGDDIGVLFECDQVSFRRGETLVLDGLTFGIEEGSTTQQWGPFRTLNGL